MNMIIITEALCKLRPNASFQVHGDTYESIVWLDTKQTIPTKQELEAILPTAEKDFNNQQADANRHAAYVAESDPLFFKAQRDEGTMAEWEAKVAEIKARYPKE